jgi:hypothetical protein
MRDYAAAQSAAVKKGLRIFIPILTVRKYLQELDPATIQAILLNNQSIVLQ